MIICSAAFCSMKSTCMHLSSYYFCPPQPPFFFFFLNSKQESANSTDEGGNTSQRSLASNPQIVHGTLNMHVDYGAVKRWVWITRDTVIMRWDIEPLFCYHSIFRAHANEKGTKIKSPPSGKKKKRKKSGGRAATFIYNLNESGSTMTSNRCFVKVNVTEKKGEGTEGKNRMRALFLFSWQHD